MQANTNFAGNTEETVHQIKTQVSNYMMLNLKLDLTIFEEQGR